MSIDQSLSKAVIALQRQHLAPETRDLVDEAARLLGDGCEGEARALIEKVEALIAADDSAQKIPGGRAPLGGHSRPSVQELIAPLTAKLAAVLTDLLSDVLEDLHHFADDQVQVVARSLQHHMDTTETVLRSVAGASERLDLISSQHHASIQALEQAREELSGAVRALRQAEREQNDSIARIAGAADELSNHLVQHADTVGSRLAGLEERVADLDRLAQEAPAQLLPLVARLDNHTESLRHLQQRQLQRVSTLNQVLDSLAKLKESEPSEMSAVA